VHQLVNTTLSQGDFHTFVCEAVADPHPLFVFRFNGERITSNSSKHTVVTNRTHGFLTVINIQGSDEGNYSCSASNRFGSASTAAVLTVEGGFEFAYACVWTVDWIVCMHGLCTYVYAHIWSIVIKTPDVILYIFLTSIIAQFPLCLLAFRLFSVMW